MDDISPVLLDAVNHLVAKRAEARALTAAIRAEHEDEFETIDTLNKEADKLAARVGDLLRAGRTSQTILGYRFRVDAPSAVTLDVGALVAKARPLGHLQTLLDVGVLSYAGKVDNIERLPGLLRAEYTEFIVSSDATARVYIPDELKA